MDSVWIFATTNPGKVREIEQLLIAHSGAAVSLLSLSEIAHAPVIEETGKTFLENARLKAWGIAHHSQRPTLADDSGLEVIALGGAPGVHSARYAGTNYPDRHQNDAANNKKLVAEVAALPENSRHARYVCVLVLADPTSGHEWVFEGSCEGEIKLTPAGKGGFGYDPYFFLPEQKCTMAEIPLNEKNNFSHRGKAFRKLIDFLPQIIRHDA